MALRYMTEFMPQHRGQLVAAAHHCQQTQMNAEIPPRQGESVDRAVSSEHQFPGKALAQFTGEVTTPACSRQQWLPDALHIVGQYRVINVVRIAVDLTRNPVAQPAFDAAAHLATVTEGRQLHCVGSARRPRCQQRSEQDQCTDVHASYCDSEAFHDRMMRDSHKRRVNLANPARRINCNEISHEFTYPF